MNTLTRVAFGVVLLSTTIARADGESSPMIGVAVIGGDTEQTPAHDAPLAGVAFDLAFWYGRIGLAAEGSARWAILDNTRDLVAGGSLRLRVLESLWPSLIDPRDVEVGVELQGIVERTWSTDASRDPIAYGPGLAIRIRGNGAEGTSLMAESRFFLRVLASRTSEVDTLARSMPTTPSPTDRVYTVLVGVGASWGRGTPRYTDQFRLHPFRHAVIW